MYSDENRIVAYCVVILIAIVFILEIHSVQSCGIHLFECDGGFNCIPESFICDGKYDCIDESDEAACGQTTESIKSPYPFCKNDGNDDKNCISTCLTMDCPRYSACITKPTGAECVCFPGFTYNDELSTCDDVNECAKFGICSHGCINSEGTYKCTCADKFKLLANKKTCTVSFGDPLLLFSTQKAVKGIYLKSKHLYTVADNLTDVVDIANDGHNIYWTTNYGGDQSSIVKAHEDGSDQDILLTSGLNAPEGLAVDWLTGNIYFSDNVLRHIAVCSNDGHYCTPLVVKDVQQPRGIDLWPQMGLMYWTDWGTNPKIARASMDGNSSIALVETDIHWPNGIALDFNNERLYWVDAKLMTIESIRMDGTDRKLILSDILKHPFGIAVFEDNLYWSDWSTKSVKSCNKFDGKDHQVIATGDRMYGLHVYHPATQPNIDHSCKKHKCSHLCLLAAYNSFSCACPDGMVLASDGTRCERTVQKQKLYVGLTNAIFEMEHTNFGKHKILQEFTIPLVVDHMTYNSVNATILIADNMQKTIGEYDTATKVLRILIRRGTLGYVTGMAFDDLAQNLYWADSERRVVEVYSLRMMQRAIIHFFAVNDVPIGIGLLPEDGKMVIALRTSGDVPIERKTFGRNGGDYIRVFKNSGPIQILPDFKSRTLYWVNTVEAKIEFSTFANMSIDFEWTSRLVQPVASVAVIDDEIFWTTVESPYLYWTHKTKLGSVKRTLLEFSSLQAVKKIQLLSSHPQPQYDHPCLHNNGGCSHVCMSQGKNSSTCFCPSGMTFKDVKNQTCIDVLHCKFRCQSGECLNLLDRCNGRKDCLDGSDEASCNSKPKKTEVLCAFNEFMCHDFNQCVLSESRCDKIEDCEDGSDEKKCNVFDGSLKCHIHQHGCENGRCIDMDAMCDGFDDCGDNSDETNCGMSLGKCGKNMFQCTSGMCIAKGWECDGYLDCIDGSDEHDKCVPKNCPKGMHRCKLGQCLDKRLVCDGHNDCGDSSDELQCTDDKQKIICGTELDAVGTPNKFQCLSDPTICLDWQAKCNGTAECPQGEDEMYCYKCSVFEFHCIASRKCIPIEFHCDGEADCSDGSDELQCNRNGTQDTHEACQPGMFDCKDGTCIDYSKTCDGQVDCENAQDETEMCKTACTKGNSCEHKCQATPYGAKCSCFDGYMLDEDQKMCSDIDECLQKGNPCAQMCNNFAGGYRCSCYKGFMLRLDKTTCKSFDNDYSLLYATHNEVRRLTERPMTLEVLLLLNDTKITSFDLDISRSKLYYTTDESNALYEWNMVNASVTLGLAVANCSKLAVDWITGNIYVVSQLGTSRLKVCSFKNNFCADIIKLLPGEVITAIAVDAISRKVFFAAITTKGFSHICVAGLDGYKYQTLITIPAMITDLEADVYKQELYFVDGLSHTLQSISYLNVSERSVKIVVQNENAIVNPSAISIHENLAFIVNKGSTKAFRCRLFGDTGCETVNWNMYDVTDIVVNSASRQEIVANDCNHKLCSGLCVHGPIGYECMCQDGSIVDEFFKCPAQQSIEIHTNFITTKEKSEVLSSTSTGTVCGILFVIVVAVTGAALYYYRNRQPQFNALPVEIKL